MGLISRAAHRFTAPTPNLSSASKKQPRADTRSTAPIRERNACVPSHHNSRGSHSHGDLSDFLRESPFAAEGGAGKAELADNLRRPFERRRLCGGRCSRFIDGDRVASRGAGKVAISGDLGPLVPPAPRKVLFPPPKAEGSVKGAGEAPLSGRTWADNREIDDAALVTVWAPQLCGQQGASKEITVRVYTVQLHRESSKPRLCS